MSNVSLYTKEDFYIVAKEPGAEHPALPTWANDKANPINLKPASIEHTKVKRVEIKTVPGAFHLLNVLSAEECEHFIEKTESLGYLPDAAVSLPRSIRHNHNVTWVVDDVTAELIWQRCAPFIKNSFINNELGLENTQALGLNQRFRFYRYAEGDFFKPHTDGSWPGSRVIDKQLVANAFDDRWSQMSFLIYLSDDFSGGNTQFWVERGSEPVNIRTPRGGVLCFPHGQHPLHCLHASDPVTSGVKYIIRTDMLFELL